MCLLCLPVLRDRRQHANERLDELVERQSHCNTESVQVHAGASAQPYRLRFNAMFVRGLHIFTA